MNMKEKGGGIWEDLERKGEGRNILLNYNLNIMIIKDIPCMNLVFVFFFKWSSGRKQS